jgi:hypothetical protein
MTWLSTSEFILITGINASSDVLVDILEFAEKDIIRHIFIQDVYAATNATSVHQIYTPLMDINGDSVITTSDITAFEVDSFGQRTYLTTSLVSVDEYSGLVTFSSIVPTSNLNLVIQSHRGKELFGDMLIELKELEKMMAVNKIFENTIGKKLIGGVTQWTLNGVSLSLDSDSMRKTIEDNISRIRTLTAQLRVKRFTMVKPGVLTHNQKFLRDWGNSYNYNRAW